MTGKIFGFERKENYMKEAIYELNLPRDNIHVRVFAHTITNYRYHWHGDEYELNILLSGSQDYCMGSKSFILKENDVLLTTPGVGHASMTQEPNTIALVLHISSSVFKNVGKKATIYDFGVCSNNDTKNNDNYRYIRFYAANLYQIIKENNKYSANAAKSCLELLAIHLYTNFSPTPFVIQAEDVDRVKIASKMLTYIEEHYNEKLTLEDLSNYTQYNRTYFSTFFKQMTGIKFHDYLTRVRFQHAVMDLTNTNDHLTDIALRNGFADLKTFNAYFKSTINKSPAQYRNQLPADRMRDNHHRYIDCENQILINKLNEYLHVGSV